MGLHLGVAIATRPIAPGPSAERTSDSRGIFDLRERGAARQAGAN